MTGLIELERLRLAQAAAPAVDDELPGFLYDAGQSRNRRSTTASRRT